MRSKGIRAMASLVLILSCLLIACGAAPKYPSDVMDALDEAGDNRSELEEVLEHYASGTDSLKLEAAYYLIGNMEGHCYATYALRDSSGKDIEFDVLDYPDFASLLEAADSLEAEFGGIDFEKDEKVHDLEVVTSEYLVGQIDYAFRAWREKPWAKQLSFEHFLDYVLPYRGSNEPLEPWRKAFWDKYDGIESGMANQSDPFQAAKIINDDIKTWFGFDERFYYHPTDQGLTQMLNNKLGRCEDMTNVTIYAMRANGLAVTSDYTPHWGDCGNNHAWNSIVTSDGKVVPFMGSESSPGDYNLGHKLAKAYRKCFGEQKGNLIFQDRKQESVPPWLAGKSYKDVTSDYVNASDVTIEFHREIPDSVDIAYLCVFNSGEWKAIHWGRIEGDTAVFTDMGPDLAYLPALYLNEEIVPFGSPFLLSSDKVRWELEHENGKAVSVELTATKPPKLRPPELREAPVSLKPDQEYELFYWSEGWQSMGKKVAGEGPLVFDNVPVGCLYWLTEMDSDKEERIFTIEDGDQVWW